MSPSRQPVTLPRVSLLELNETAPFGPGVQQRDEKTARAEATGREAYAMQNIPEKNGDGKRGEQFSFSREKSVRAQNSFDRAVILYEALVRRAAQSGPYCEEIEITPDLARVLLQKNESNRTLKPRVVADIARDISEGRWRVNGETIIVSRDGKTNDGQHRLHAVIQSDTAIRTFVSVGVERETRSTVDSTQTTRTPGDFVSMDGILDGNIVASIAGYLWQIQQHEAIPNDPHAAHNRPTKQQVVEFAKEHEAAIHAGLKAVPSKNTSRIASRSVLVVAYLLIRSRFKPRAQNENESVIDAFFLSLLNGGKGDGDPIFTVRELMLEDKRRKRFTPRRGVELTLRAWNAHRGQRTLTKALGTGQWPAIER